VFGAPSASSLTLRAPDGSTARLSVLRRKALDPRDVLTLTRSTRDLAGTLATAPFLSRRARELLEQAGASYADGTGNVRIVIDKPGLYVETEGAQKDPGRAPRPLASLKGPAAARVVRALCDVRPPYGVRRLAQIATAAPSSVTRVVSLLEKEALVTRASRDQITEVDWAGLIQRWAQDYQVLSSNEVLTLLAPRGLATLADDLRTFKGRMVVTGSLAAAQRAPVAPARIAMLYVEDPSRVAKGLGLRAAEAGANVMLLRPLDDVAFTRTWVAEGVTYAALSQVAADLLTAPGRAPSEGEELLAWMKKNPDAWRT
jgi:DNA-binding transcriptional regulator YhcF (GntR family)